MPFRILALGSNSSGQLGIGHSEDTSEPQECIFPDLDTGDVDEEVTKIVGGGNHTLLLTSKGRVWVAGRNDDGRCGLPATADRGESFHRVDVGSFIEGGEGLVTSVAATWEASVLVVDRRIVLTCGTGLKGELGQGPEVVKSPSPKRVVMIDELMGQDARVVEAVAGVTHVLVLTSFGEVFGWGSSRKGQLGEDAKADKIVWQPRRINVPFKVQKAVAGRDVSYIVGRDNEQLLLGDAKHFAGRVDLPIYAFEVYGVGRNDRGQLLPPNLPPLRDFAAGSEHCIACTYVGEVISWGWGEHGNCGRPVDDDRGNIVDTYNTIPVLLQSGETVTGVAAGCATSFIVIGKAR